MNAVDPGLIALFILAPIILFMIVLCYIAHKYTEYFESFLPNCTYVTGNKKYSSMQAYLAKSCARDRSLWCWRYRQSFFAEA